MPHDRSPPHPDAPPLPRPLTIAERRELQALWERAWNAARSPSSDPHTVHQLIRDCVIRDPASPVYVDVLLENCARLANPTIDTRRAAHHSKKASWFRRWQARAKIAAAVARQDWFAVLRDGPDSLFANPVHLPTLLALADACTQLAYRDSAWKYLEAARRLAPDSPDVLRRAARARLRRGQFADATAQWRRLTEQSPTDAEARRWLELFEPFLPSIVDPPVTPDTPEAAAAQFDDWLATGRFAVARQWLVKSRHQAGQDLAWNHRAEDLSIAEHWRQVEIARHLVEFDPQGDWQELVAELSRTALRVEVELLANRAQRHPGDAILRFRLAIALKRQGNWSEAIAVFDGAQGPNGGGAEAKLEQGECWQRLRQFGRALACYRSALEIGDENSPLRPRIIQRLERLGISSDGTNHRPDHSAGGVNHRDTEDTETE